MITFSQLFFIRSFSYLQVTKTCIKARMSLNFRQIPQLTIELTVLEGIKIDVTTFSRLLLIRFFLNLQVMRTCIISWMSLLFGHIGPSTTEFAALERREKFPYLKFGKRRHHVFKDIFDRTLLILSGNEDIRGLSIKYVDFLNNSKLFYDN